MAQISFPNKNTGDTFSATEATEVKTVVNANDTAQTAAISLRQLSSEKGAVNGYAPLGADSRLPIVNAPIIASPAVNSIPVVSGDTYQSVVDKLQSQVATALSNAGNPLQTETTIYINRVKAKTNTFLNSVTIQAIDRFFVQGKAEGWLSKMAWIYCPLSTTLAGALVNLYNIVGVANEVTNNGFVAADYDESLGIGTRYDANTSKFLGTGIILNSLPTPINNQNISFGMFIPDDSNNENRPFFGLNPVTGNTPIFINGGSLASVLANSNIIEGAVHPCLIQGSCSNSTSYNVARNSTVTVEAVNNSSLTAAALDTELTLFKGGFGGNSLFSKGKIAFTYVGTSLSRSETENMGKAIRGLMESTNRVNSIGGRILVTGDSTMAGVGASSSISRGTTLLSRDLGVNEFNIAQGTAQLRQDANVGGTIYLGFANYAVNIFNNLKSNTVVSGWGTNDMNNADGTANGDATIIADYQSKYISALNYFKIMRLRIIVSGVMWNSTATYTKRNAYTVAAYNAAVANDAVFLNANDLFSDTPVPVSYFADGLHPNDTGYVLWASAMLELINGRIFRNLSLGFPSVAAGGTQDITTTILGAKVGMATNVSTLAITGLEFKSWVSASNTVTTRATNNTGAAIAPTAQYFRITVFLGAV